MTDQPPERTGADAVLAVECALPEGIDPDVLRRAGTDVLRLAGIERGTHVTITLVDLDQMAELKRDAFGIHDATDVLAFGVDDPRDPGPGPFVLGDVVVCPDVAVRQARALGRPPIQELTTLMTHGILHLLGHDHGTPAAEREMAAVQDRIVAEALA